MFDFDKYAHHGKCEVCGKESDVVARMSSLGPMIFSCCRACLTADAEPYERIGMTRADTYRYTLEEWGLDTKASACAFCPFHRNYFYRYIQRNDPVTYDAILGIDDLLRDKTPMPPMKSKLFMSRSRKRIADLTPEDCRDAECFDYCGRQVWNGF